VMVSLIVRCWSFSDTLAAPAPRCSVDVAPCIGALVLPCRPFNCSLRCAVLLPRSWALRLKDFSPLPALLILPALPLRDCILLSFCAFCPEDCLDIAFGCLFCCWALWFFVP